MSVFYTIPNSTYAGYEIMIPRIEYISRVNFKSKMKEYIIEIGYDSKEFSKFTLSFNNEKDALLELSNLKEQVRVFYSTK